ncbi:MAG: InlB B-repeat-containing protein, partial [Solobacterium sp.]|nr:InlB B-repeat-containing protein [Solobacterium sp.]
MKENFKKTWQRWLALFMAVTMVMTSGIISTNQSLRASGEDSTQEVATDPNAGGESGGGDVAADPAPATDATEMTVQEEDPPASEEETTPTDETDEAVPTEETIVEETPAQGDEPVQQDVPAVSFSVDAPATTYTITYTDNGNVTYSSKPETVNAGDSNLTFVVAANEGYKLTSVKVNDEEVTGSNGSYTATVTANSTVNVTTEAVTPTIVSLKVYFSYENGNIASATYSTEIAAGSEYSVPVPSIPGYTAMIGEDAAPATITGTAEEAPIEITVTYKAGEIYYTVTHHYEVVNAVDHIETQTIAGAVGEETKAAQTSFDGYDINNYNVNDFSQATLVAGADINIDIYYKLKTVYLNYNTDGGSYVARQSGKYGEEVSVTDTIPTKQGYTFDRWYTDAEHKTEAGATVALDNLNGVTLYAGWTAANTTYSIAYWKEQVTKGQYDLEEYVPGNTATVGSKVSGSANGKSYRYFTFDHADKDVEVKADGSTIVNVYFKRTVYTLTFNLNNDNANLSINGQTYTGSSYTVEMRLGEDISSKWPTATNVTVSRGNKFEGWTQTKYFNGGTIYVSKRLVADTDILPSNGTTRTYYGYYPGNTQKYELHYYLQNANDDGYTDSPDYQQTAYAQNTFLAKTILGYEHDSSRDKGYYAQDGKEWVYVQEFYYTRNTYNIEFYNNNKLYQTVEDVKFEQNISQYNITNPTRPSGIKSYMTFQGWYTNVQCVGEPFDFTNATMPSYTLVLYAKWAPKTVTVQFNTDGGTSVDSQEITAGTSVAKPADPTKDGYVFDGWYTDANYTTTYDFSQPVEKGTTIYGRWTRAEYADYTVKFINSDTGEEIANSSYTRTNVKVGTTVYVQAKTFKDLIADKLYRSLTIDADSKLNIITFYYSEPKAIAYYAQYVDEKGNALGDKFQIGTTEKQTQYVFARDFKEQHPVPDGYELQNPFVVLSVSSDENDNVAKFICSKFVDVTLTANSNSGEYSGVPITAEGYSGFADTSVFTNGQLDSIIASTSQTDVGTYVTSFDTNAPKEVTADDGTIYRIKYNTGTLTITAAPLTVTTGSASKVYDGQPLTKADATIGELV